MLGELNVAPGITDDGRTGLFLRFGNWL
jgi:hypothetical protein